MHNIYKALSDYGYENSSSNAPSSITLPAQITGLWFLDKLQQRKQEGRKLKGVGEKHNLVQTGHTQFQTCETV